MNMLLHDLARVSVTTEQRHKIMAAYINSQFEYCPLSLDVSQ